MLLGIDLGTTALKCAGFDYKGTLLAVSTQEYNLETPEIDFVEMPVERYWNAIKNGLLDLKKQYDYTREKVSISFSVQGETLLFVGEEGKVINNAIVWMDNRAHKEAEQLRKKFSDEECYRKTGQVSFEPCWPASKILWMKNNRPDIFTKIKYFMLLEDYIIFRMTGKIVTEGSLLCSSTYWNIVTKKYWKEMLEFLGITEEQLPKVYESGEYVGEMLAEVKKELGFEGQVIVVTGTLDQAAGAIGVGNISEGMVSEAIGAALAICVPVKKPVFDPNRKMPLHYFAIKDTYMIHTFTNGGMTLRWYRDKFCQQEVEQEKLSGTDAYDLIGEEVAQIPAGSEGLIMLPHLTGSLAPDVNSKAKGVWFGFTMKHTKAHFARSIMESLGYILHRNIDALAAMNVSVKQIRALGGGSKSTVWNQIQADINRIEIVTMNSKEAACLGAAILAGKGIGIYTNIEEAVQCMVNEKKIYIPDEKNIEVYEKGYELYCKLFENVKECFAFK